MKNNQFCCICLEKNENLYPIIKTDENGCSSATKLRTCIVEIEWKDDYMICPSCGTSLQLVHEFREKCISSESSRQQQFVKVKIEPLQLYTEVKIETEQHNTENTEIFQSEVAKTKREKINFPCEFCEVILKSGKKLISHCVEQHQADPKSIKPYPCQLCSSRFSSAQYLLQHLVYHKDERKFVCTFCGKGYKTKNDLNIHERIHLNKRDYKCEKCSKTFNTHKSLRTHKIGVHTDPNLWKHVCQLCSKRFAMKASLDAHLRRHNNERPFGCHLCDKNFVDKCNLQKHIKSHSNNREFSCDVCNKLYKEKRIMERHKKKCHGDSETSEKVLM